MNSLGFKTADVSLRLTDGVIQAKSLTGDVIAVEADASGIASQTITMSNMPHEDLLVLVTGGGARSIGAVYGDVMPAPERSPISIKVSDDNGTLIEILDSDTGHSIATRLLDQNGFANFEDYQFELRGSPQKGDQFTVSQNLKATGDGRNMNLLLNLQTADANGTSSGGFQQVFNTIVASVGAAVRSGDISLEAATATRDAAAEAESEFSGVNLDSEAAALMEFQQAYQASARVLSTARELFQSLLDVV
jgi:flagellar hook-associated protein 1 FlgK